MPYPSLDSLPEQVKAIPSGAQEIWRNAVNSALAKGQPEENAMKIGWGAVKRTWQKVGDAWKKKQSMKAIDDEMTRIHTEAYVNSMLYLDDETRANTIANAVIEHSMKYVFKDDSWQVKEIYKEHEFDAEIMSVGTWNGDKFTEEHLDQMVNAFTKLKEKIKPPVKLGHDEGKWSDGLPALGWVTGLKRTGQKLIAHLSNVPELIYKAIQASRYKRVSSEVYFQYQTDGETFPRVLAGVALLGADIPAVKNIADLTKYLKASGGEWGALKQYTMKVDDHGSIHTEVDKMGELEDLKKKFTDLEGNIKGLEEKATKAEADKAKAEKELKEFQDTQSKQKKVERTKTIETYCEGQVKDGKMAPAARDQFVKDLKEGKFVYTEEHGFAIPFSTYADYAIKHRDMLDGKEYTADGKPIDKKKYADATDEVMQKAKEYKEKHPKEDLGTCTVRVLEADADLAKRYEEDSSRVGEED